MTLHGLTASGTYGRLASDRVGHGSHLTLQRFPHEWPVLDFHFTLQHHELRDFLQRRALRGPRSWCGGGTRLTLFGQEPPASRRPPTRSQRAPSGTLGAVQPALDKTENSIAGLGRNVQQNRNVGERRVSNLGLVQRSPDEGHTGCSNYWTSRKRLGTRMGSGTLRNCGMLLSAGFKGELAVTLANGRLRPVTANYIRKRINKSAEEAAEAAGF